MGILSGNPKNEPMHYGEVFHVWSYLSGTNQMLACYQTYLNHNGDDDLDDILRDMIRSMKEEINQLEEILKPNGIALPPAPPEKPIANIEDIPAGARFSDQEIAASVSMELAQGIVMCSQIMGQCIREDIAAMFGKFHTTKAAYAARLLRINKEKGWLIPPPLHLKTPELATV
ncbi:DUF3231 family protein [Bacillus pinisoli]|uniref:DUF3231 family protein n=1 Tax=Bacillus pinisoli TaxID=2901866 RepID=UPI001FF30FB1|nr:DUF3231 family protein [Bacillus pinisoli]